MLTTPYNLTQKTRQLFEFLVQSPSETMEFFGRHWLGEEQQWQSVVNYRLYKINVLNVSVSQFIEEFRKDNKRGLELLLQHPVDEDQLKKLNDKLEGGKTTLEKLYSKFSRDRSKELLYLIL